MIEYTSKETAKEIVFDKIINNIVEDQGMYGYLVYLVNEAFDEAPAADVRPVVRGEWWPIFEADENGEPYEAGFCCSECHTVLQYEPYFCPDCGAEMRAAKR